MSFNNFSDQGKPLNSSLPRQQLPLKDKLKNQDKFGISDWMKNCLDAGESLGRYQYYQNLPLKVNYGIVSKEFRLADYYDVSDYYDFNSAIAQEFNVPYHLKHYDITGKYVNLLVGEYLKRPDVFNVRASDPESVNERIQVKTDLMKAYLQQSLSQRINNQLVQMGYDPNRTEFKNEEEAQKYQQEIQQKYQELTPDSIEKYMRYDFRNAAEHWAVATLSNDRYRFNFRELEKVEFTDMLIADRCFSHVYLTPIGYNLETWNPMNTFFHQAPEIRNAEEGDFAGRVLYMTKSQIVDRFGWRMQEEQIRMLYPKDYDGRQNIGVYGEFFNATMMPFSAYRDYSNVTTSLGYDPFNNSPVGNLPTLQQEDTNYGFPNYQFATGDICQITEFYWRSQRKIGKLSILNPDTGETDLHIVDETFDPKLFGIKELKNTSIQDVEENQEPNTIVWTWVTQIWQGCKVNANFAQSVEDRDRNAIYFDIRPCPFQFKGDFSPFKPKLPVIGGVFNNRNGKSNSFVDLLKPYQIAYNAFMNLAYGIAQRNNGKMAMLDLRLLSNFKDWGGEQALEKAITIGRELGFLPLDTSLSNIGEPISMNQFSVLDLDESEKVERLMKLAIVWEEQGAKQVGITPQRQGQTQASETATGVQQAINNSYAVTEPYFENFYNYKRRKLIALLDIAQYCASKERDIVLQYTTSDLGEAFIKVNGTELMLRDIGVNVNNAQETIQELELIKRLAIENNTTKLPMSALIKMISLKSVADITKATEQAEAEQQKEIQAQREHEMQMQQQQIEAQQQQDAANKAFEAEQNQLDREAEIQKEVLKGVSAEGSYSQDTDTTGLLIEQGKLSLEQSRLSNDNAFKQQQLTNQLLGEFNKNKLEKEKMNHDKKLKESDAKAKKQIETEKLKQIESQNRNQEKLAKDKHKSDMEIVDKQLEMKGLELKMKQLEVENAKKKSNIELDHIEQKIELEKDLAEVKAEAVKKVSKVKEQEASKISKLKIKENEQTHEHKLEQNEEKHKAQLKINAAKAKQSLKDASKSKKKK